MMTKKITFVLLFTYLSFTTLKSQTVNQIIVGANNNGAVFSANLDGSNPTIVDAGQSYYSYYGSVADNTHQKIFMAWFYGIYSMNFDGSDWQQLVNLGSGYGSAIDIDPVNEKIYYFSGGVIKMDYDGTNQETVINLSSSASDMQLDLENNQVYYTVRWGSNKGLKRVDLDGNNPITLTNENISNFKINFDTNKIFYSIGAEGRVMDLDGSNSSTILNNQVGEFDFDHVNNKVYYTDMSNKMIKRANYDGTNIENLIEPQDIIFDSEPMDIPSGLVLVNNSTLSTDQLNLDTMAIKPYPNPTTQAIKLEGLKNGEDYTLSNALGQVIKTGFIESSEAIHLENFDNGMYFLKLKNGLSFKIIKN